MADSHNQDRFRLPTYLDPTRPIRLVGRAVGAAFAKQGHPPGTLVQPYRAPDEHATLRLISYANEELVERDLDGLSDLGDPEGVVWINLDGVHDVDLVRQVSEHFGLHPLLMEDLVTVGRRPKYEEYDPYLFVVLQMLTVKPGTFQVVEEQVSFVLGNGVLLTFQERQGDVFELVRERLRLHSGRIRTRGADYLCYALMDTLIDGYFGVLDALGRATEGLDADLEGTPGPETIRRIHEVKRETLILRRSVWPPTP